MKTVSTVSRNENRGRKPTPLKLVAKDGVRPEVAHLEQGHIFTGGLTDIAALLNVPYHTVHNSFKKDGTFHGLKLTKNIGKKSITINNTTLNLTINNNESTEIKEFTINQKFDMIGSMVSMVCEGNSNALIISGDGGLGKTHTVVSAIKEHKLEEDKDVMTIKGYSTPKALYCKLYEAMQINKKMLVVFDDCDSILENDTAINILQGHSGFL